MPNTLDIETALKKVRSEKPRENRMVIKLSWDKQLVLPYNDGIAFLNTLQRAEILEEPYQKTPIIKGPERNSFETTVMSPGQYEDIKVAALLNVTLDELQQSRTQPVEAK